MVEVKYHYALDENGNLVPIESVTKEQAKTCKFTCLSCGKEMIACACESEKVRPYFRHKVETDSCGCETYLHKLAKRLIREKFDNNEKPFLIKIYGKEICCKSASCQFATENCSQEKITEVDLHKYYDTCTEETPIDGFVADLLLTDSTGKHKTPVLIEIKVKHKCSLEKIGSDLKIIELDIKNEDDIKYFTENDFVEMKRWDFRKEGIVHFYNFTPKTTQTQKPLNIKWGKRFWFYKSGSCKLERNLPCGLYDKKTERHSLFELNLDVPSGQCSPWSLGLVYLKDNGIDVKNCLLCKYHHYDNMNFPICALYKSKDTPRNPDQDDAQKCNYYREDNDEIQEIRKLLQEGKVSANLVR